MHSAEAQTISQEGLSQEYFPPVTTHLLHSEYVKQTFKVQVMRPACKRGESVRFPVLYVTDGNLTFDMFKGISYLLQCTGHDAPRYILVGIGYPAESPRAGAVLRARDLTFPHYPQVKGAPPSSEGVLLAEAGTKDFYGAPDFQQFIESELIPFIDKRYDTVPGERIYFGHSGGGGFGLFTLFSRPRLFTGYIVSSPGLVFDGKSPAGVQYDDYDFVSPYAREFIASTSALNGTSLYMSVGAEEEFERIVRPWRLTSSFYRLAALLKSAEIPGLRVTTEVFPGETHMTVWPMSFIHGVQAIFGTGRWRGCVSCPSG